MKMCVTPLYKTCSFATRNKIKTTILRPKENRQTNNNPIKIRRRRRRRGEGEVEEEEEENKAEEEEATLCRAITFPQQHCY
jgi:hypothetical protein